MTEDIVAMARAAGKDERLSDGALYGKLADEIERLRALLQEMPDLIKDIDGGNPETTSGWASEELLDLWMRVNAALTANDIARRLLEAGAEIERLRAALQEIADADYLPDGVWAIDRARRALETKP